MKISEMNNEQAAEALIRISEPFGNICDDEEFTELLGKFENGGEGISNLRLWGRMIPQFVAFAFKKHKADLYEIVGALSQKTTVQVAKMNFVETINTVKESYDDVLKGFFTSSGKQTAGQEAE